jgi:hypothetical protein
VAIVAEAYLMAGNLGAYGYAGLTTGAAHLIEAFGDDWLRDAVHAPHVRRRVDRHHGADRAAGRLEPRRHHHPRHPRTADGSYRVTGNKIFISGRRSRPHRQRRAPDLARLDGAPPGTKASRCSPSRAAAAPPTGALVDNDVSPPA